MLVSIAAAGMTALWGTVLISLIQLYFHCSPFDCTMLVRSTAMADRWNRCVLLSSTCNSLIWELAGACRSGAMQILLLPAVAIEAETGIMCTDCIQREHNRSNHAGNSADLCLCLTLTLFCMEGAGPSSRNGMKWWQEHGGNDGVVAYLK